MGIMREGLSEPYVTDCHPAFLENIPEAVTTPVIIQIDTLGMVTIKALPIYLGDSPGYQIEPGEAVANIRRDPDGRVTVSQVGRSL